MRPYLLLIALGAVACVDKSIALGGGEPPDARLYADIYTWECQDPSVGELYEGVYAYKVSLEYAPDALTDRDLPSSGCEAGVDVFPSDAGSGGVDIPDATTPGWATSAMSGELDRRSDGFYYDDVFNNQSTCQDVSDLMGDGAALSDAGSFSGASSPSPGAIDDVTLTGEVDDETGLPFGSEVTATWDADGWDRSWVQIRREKAGSLVESVTCATNGDSFTVDDDVWSLLHDALEVDVTNLYVAFEAEGGSSTSDGQDIVTYTRAMHVAVVQD